MEEDELLRRLAELARQQEEEERTALDARWDALAAGRLGPEEEAALRAQAERSMSTELAYQAFAPLGPELRDRMVEQARSQLSGSGSRPPAKAHAERQASEPAGRLSPRRRARSRRREGSTRRSRAGWLGWTAAIASLAAAGLVLVVWRTGQSPPLPPYRASLGGSVQELRSGEAAVPAAPAAPARFVAGNAFELIVRPDQAVTGPLAVHTLERHGETLRRWTAPVEISRQGTVRIAGEVGAEIRLPAGETTLVVVVGRPGSLPSPEELADRLGRSAPLETQNWVAFRLPVVLEEGP